LALRTGRPTVQWRVQQKPSVAWERRSAQSVP